MTDSTVANLAMHVHKKVGDVQLHTVQCSTLNRAKGRLVSYDHYTTQKKAEAPKRFVHQFSLQLYSARELQEILANAGFETVAQYEMDGTKFIEDENLSILTVARKKWINER
jgi:hypothetical protein